MQGGSRFGVRHIQILLVFMLTLYCYVTRIILSVGIVAMTDNSTTSNPDIPVYQWNNKSVILSSFFWGYIALMPFTGYIVNIFGAKRFLTGMIIVNSAACFAIPFTAAEFGADGVILMRVIQGVAQSFMFPSSHALLGKWVPASERSALGAIAYSGSTLGAIIGMTVTGWISSTWAGWPMNFYIFAGLGILCLILLVVYGSDQPSDNRSISSDERSYIETSLGTLGTKPKLPIPWKYILTSVPLYAVCIGEFGIGWGTYTLLTELPNFLNKVMQFDINSNAMLSASPYAAQLVLSYIFGFMSDYVINRNYLSRTVARKVFHNIGCLISAVALTIFTFMPEDLNSLALFILLLGVGIMASVNCGVIVNIIDLAPNFSGITMSISNNFSIISGILSPLLVQVIVTEETDKYQWRIIFLVTSAILVATSAIYFIFGSAETQYWNDPEKSEKTTRKL